MTTGFGKLIRIFAIFLRKPEEDENYKNLTLSLGSSSDLNVKNAVNKRKGIDAFEHLIRMRILEIGFG